MTVAILGASNDSQRFANRAQRMLTEHGFGVIPVSLSAKNVLGEMAYRSLTDIPTEKRPVDTVTVYVNPRNFEAVVDDVLELKPRRIIFNPGSEHEEAADSFRAAGIDVVNACTLVMLEAGQF